MRRLGNADLAQLVEQLIRNEQVVGSSPIIGSRKQKGSFSREKEPFVLLLFKLLLPDNYFFVEYRTSTATG